MAIWEGGIEALAYMRIVIIQRTQALGWTTGELAVRSDMKLPRVNDILGGTADPTLREMSNLGHALGIRWDLQLVDDRTMPGQAEPELGLPKDTLPLQARPRS